jgi:hypothetical protein
MNSINLKKIEDALHELARNRHEDYLHPDDREMLLEALKVCEGVRENTATDEQLDEARDRWMFGTKSFQIDDLEIDDDAGISQTDDGYWIQSWFWVPNVN